MWTGLAFEAEDLLSLTDRRVWVSVKRFRVKADVSDESLLDTLVGLPEFQGSYHAPMGKGARLPTDHHQN